MSEYIVLKAYYRTQLMDEVNKYLAQGYQLVGGVSVSLDVHLRLLTFYQAVWIAKKPVEKK